MWPARHIQGGSNETAELVRLLMDQAQVILGLLVGDPIRKGGLEHLWFCTEPCLTAK